MTTTTRSQCPVCGESLIREEVGTWIKLRCPACGYEQEAHWVPSSEELGLVRDDVDVEVTAVWKSGRPSVAEVQALRKVVPDLANESVNVLKERVSTGERFSLGKMKRPVAKRLREKAEQLGLTLEYEEPAQ